MLTLKRIHTPNCNPDDPSRAFHDILRLTAPNGDVIIVQLVRASSGEARIGIEAPKEYNILREEVYQRYYQG